MFAVLPSSLLGLCDTTRSQRDAARASIAATLSAQSFVAEKASYECILEDGKAGAGNPESVTCYYVSEAAQEQVTASANQTERLHAPPVFQLGESDVLVHLGCTPPRPGPLYYGFSPYLFGFNALSALRARPGGQLTDSLNQLELNTTASLWGSSFAMVASADEGTRDATVSALASAGFRHGVNTMTFPPALLDLGLGLSKSFLLLGSRAGPWRDAADKATYAKASTEVVQIFRAKGHAPARPLPTPEAKPRHTNHTERALLSAREATLLGVARWAASVGLRVVRRVELRPQLRDGVISNGSECVLNRSTAGCALDTTDAAYMDSPPLPALGGGSIDVVVGTNQFATRKATYSSVTAYTMPVGGGQGAVLGGAAMSSMDYTGSAARFRPMPEAAQFFALTVRPASEPCAAAERWCLNATLAPKRTAVQLVYVTRAYLEPSTHTGPDPHDLLPAVVLRLER